MLLPMCFNQSVTISPSMLYNLVHCPHRVSMDLFADPAVKPCESPPVQFFVTPPSHETPFSGQNP